MKRVANANFCLHPPNTFSYDQISCEKLKWDVKPKDKNYCFVGEILKPILNPQGTKSTALISDQ